MSNGFSNIQFPEKPAKLVIAASGGADSMFLLAAALGTVHQIVAAHVNYNKRGLESDADEALVRSYCVENGVPLYVASFNEDVSSNFQHQARVFRYGFFEKVRNATCAQYLLLGHHKDDNYENLLFRFFRDGTPMSVKGIDTQREAILRPLLHIGKSEILDTLRHHSIPWREDQSNQENEFTRNRLRNVIIPELNELFPGWKEKMENQSGLNVLLEQSVDELLKRITLEKKTKLSRNRWLELDIDLKKLVLSRWVQVSTGYAPSNDWTGSLVAQLGTRDTGVVADVHKGWQLVRNRNVFLLVKKTETVAESGSEHITLEKISSENNFQFCDNRYRLTISEWTGKPLSDALELAFDSKIFPMIVRSWRSGDRIRPLGMAGTKLVSDLLTNARAETHRKNEARVVETFDGTICAVIFDAPARDRPGVVSEDFACRDAGQKTIIIERN